MIMRIALAQINCCVGDTRNNTKKIIRNVDRARALGCDLVVFPELAVTGYPPEDLILKQSFIDQNLESIDKIKDATKSIITVVGFIDKGERVYNSAAVIQNRKIRGVYRKLHLPNYGVFDENRYFKSDRHSSVYIYGPTAFGVNICEDIWYPGDPTKTQVKYGNAGLIINISSSPYHHGKPAEREKMLSKRASDYSCAVAFCNLIGGQDELVFDGHSCIIDKNGDVVSRAKGFREEMIVHDLQIDEIKGKRQKRAVVKHFDFINLSEPKKKRKKKISTAISKFSDETEEIYNALVLGTKDYVRKNGFKKTIIGLSGGIDSSLVAVIAVEAIGAKNVLGLLMPSKYSSAGSIKHTRKLAANLGIDTEQVAIKKIYNSYHDDLRPYFKNTKSNIAEENLQARIRGNILMAFSNKFGHLVLTTGNKSEFSVGYTTLYGDMAGGFAVIKDVPKTMVYSLAKFYNKFRKKEIIPSEIILKEPSAELRPNQKDTDTLPPYDQLDRILKYYIEDDMSVSQIVELGEDKNTVELVTKMVDLNEYKRRQSPPGIKITTKAFGKDRRMPITSRFGL